MFVQQKSMMLKGGLATVAALVCLARGVAAGGELVIVADGKSDYVIALAEENVDAKKVREAGELLRDTIRESTGMELALVGESSVADGTPAIYLGRTKAARAAGIDVEAVKGWGYRQRAVNADVFLVGEDSPGKPELAGFSGYSGTLKAVTAFLEKVVGVRYVLPGPLGTHVPKSDRVTVDADLDRSWSPLFQYIVGRAVRLHRDGRDYVPYGIANNYFGNSPGDSKVFKHYGSHSFPHVLPEDEYFDAHPEYFALLGGVRTRKGNHLCISNLEAREFFFRDMAEQYDKGYQMVMFSPSDGYRECGCDVCQAIHSDQAEKLWIVQRQVAEEVQRRFPGKDVVFQAYQSTLKPPQTFDTFPDNVVINNNRYSQDFFDVWRPYNVRHGVYMPKWLWNYQPSAPRHEVELVRRFLRNNVIGIYIGGGLDGYTGNSWGLNGPLYYAFGKALEDPERDADELEREYIDAAFGAAAGAMRDFFTPMHRRAEFLTLLHRRGTNVADPTHRGYAFDGKVVHIFTPETLKKMSTALDRALDLAATEKVMARIKLVEGEFAWLRSIATVGHLFRAYRAAPCWETLGVLEEHVRTHKETIEWLQANDAILHPGGADQLRQPFSGKIPGMPKNAPYNWDFTLLREKDVLPGVGMKRMEAHRVARLEIDGHLDEAAWEDIPFEEIGQIAMGRAPSETWFKAAYDDKNLYVAFKGTVTSSTALDDVAPMGHDGTVWKQENMELMIDPFGTRRTYYHYIVNPVAGSYLERRFGYFDDPEHPLYQDFEWDWDEPWAYATAIDKPALVWTAELKIPFASLEVEPPVPGDLWTLNAGRNEYFENGEREAYLWSPNLETRTFHDIAAFGELVFR